MTTVRHGDGRAAEDPKPPKAGAAQRSVFPDGRAVAKGGSYVTSARRGLTGVNAAIRRSTRTWYLLTGDLKRALTRSRRVGSLSFRGLWSRWRGTGSRRRDDGFGWRRDGHRTILARVAATLGRLHDARNFPHPSNTPEPALPRSGCDRSPRSVGRESVQRRRSCRCRRADRWMTRSRGKDSSLISRRGSSSGNAAG
jgi:hypothetical protein